MFERSDAVRSSYITGVVRNTVPKVNMGPFEQYCKFANGAGEE
jgi:hypothetical protein